MSVCPIGAQRAFTTAAMRRAAWRRSVAKRAGVAVGGVSPGKRLRSIETLKSLGMEQPGDRAPAGRQ